MHKQGVYAYRILKCPVILLTCQLMLQERDWLMLLSCVGAREGAQLSGSGRRHLDQPRRRPSTDCTQQSAGASHQAES